MNIAPDDTQNLHQRKEHPMKTKALCVITALLVTLASFGLTQPAQAETENWRPHPEYVTCSIARHYYTNPDSATATNCSGSGLFRFRIDCYYFDGRIGLIRRTPFLTTLFTKSVSLSCTSTYPFLASARIENVS